MLKYISGGTPALFGDILFMGDGYLVMGNCGGSSIYYSCLSRKVKDVLPKLTIAQNFEGRGGAVGYDTQKDNMLSMVRLLKIKG